MAGGQIGDSRTLKNAFVATLGEKSFVIDDAGEGQAVIDGKTYSYSFTHIKDDKYSLILDGKCFEIIASEHRNGTTSDYREVLVSVNGKQQAAQVEKERTHRLKSLFAKSAEKSADQTVKAPMPGLISRLEVVVGEEVVPGKGLLVLEAMKMENEIKSTLKGKVTQIFVEKGRVVEKGESLITISGQ